MSLEKVARELAEICLAECLFPDCGCMRCRKAREVMEALSPQITQAQGGDGERWSLCVECRAPVGKDERLCWACDQRVRTVPNEQVPVDGEISSSPDKGISVTAKWGEARFRLFPVKSCTT